MDSFYAGNNPGTSANEFIMTRGNRIVSITDEGFGFGWVAYDDTEVNEPICNGDTASTIAPVTTTGTATTTAAVTTTTAAITTTIAVTTTAAPVTTTAGNGQCTFNVANSGVFHSGNAPQSFYTQHANGQASATGVNAPPLLHYVGKTADAITGGDAHMVMALIAQDGSYVGVGDGAEAGFNRPGPLNCFVAKYKPCVTSAEYDTVQASLDPKSSHKGAYINTKGTNCAKDHVWMTTLGTKGVQDSCPGIAESPDGTYYAVVGVSEDANKNQYRKIYKIRASDGQKMWQKQLPNVEGLNTKWTGAESVKFAADGGLIVGGWSYEASTAAQPGFPTFKSAGQVSDGANPILEKIAATTMAKRVK